MLVLFLQFPSGKTQPGLHSTTFVPKSIRLLSLQPFLQEINEPCTTHVVLLWRFLYELWWRYLLGHRLTSTNVHAKGDRRSGQMKACTHCCGSWHCMSVSTPCVDGQVPGWTRSPSCIQAAEVQAYLPRLTSASP